MPEGRTRQPSHRSDVKTLGGDPDERLLSGRGVVLVVVAVVVGALLLPAATRAPLRPLSASSSVVAPAAGASSGGSVSAPAVQPGPAGGSSAPASSTAPVRSAAAQPAPGAAGPAPSTVHVLVANGSNVNGLAASVSAALRSKGYAVAAPVSALTTVPSTVLYPLDATGQAAVGALQSLLGVGASAVLSAQNGPPPVSDDSGIDVVVVAGPDAASRFPPGSAGG